MAFPLGGFELLVVGFVLMALAGFVVRVIAIVHVLVRDDLTGMQRLIWAVLAFLVPFVALVYLIMGRERTRRLFADVGAAPATGA